MFDNCTTVAELNEARLFELRSGCPAVLVNKEYARRKALLISGESRGFKRVSFVPVPIVEPDLTIGVNYAYEEEGENTMFVFTGVMNEQ